MRLKTIAERYGGTYNTDKEKLITFINDKRVVILATPKSITVNVSISKNERKRLEFDDEQEVITFLESMLKEKDDIFINMTQHELTNEQKEVILNDLNVNRIVNWKDVLSKNLHPPLMQSPFEVEKLVAIAGDVVDQINNYSKNFRKVYLHLPIGSPAFQAIFARKFDKLYHNVEILYSHTKRIVIEKKGAKESKFKFEGFIKIPRLVY